MCGAEIHTRGVRYGKYNAEMLILKDKSPFLAQAITKKSAL